MQAGDTTKNLNGSDSVEVFSFVVIWRIDMLYSSQKLNKFVGKY